MSNLFFSDPVTTGILLMAYREPGAVPPTTTYTITVVNAAHFVTDYGVSYAATGVPLQDVGAGSLTAAGQYKVDVATGVYTFDASDASALVIISYEYSSPPGAPRWPWATTRWIRADCLARAGIPL